VPLIPWDQVAVGQVSKQGRIQALRLRAQNALGGTNSPVSSSFLFTICVADKFDSVYKYLSEIRKTKTGEGEIMTKLRSLAGPQYDKCVLVEELVFIEG
jgi:hypothetical protein